MDTSYLDIIQTTSISKLLSLPHKHVGTHPTGFVILTDSPIQPFQFTLCPLRFAKDSDPIAEGNPHDVIVKYSKEDGNLETLLYTLWELYKEKHLEQTKNSWKRYIYSKREPPRKVIIPCLGRIENLIAVLKRFQMIDVPSEGYRPILCIVEHSPYPELEQIADEYSCEYMWILLDITNPRLPIGQFNKALCYDKAFLFTSPATWYLFHDNDVLVPMDFWKRLDANVVRANTKFLQPYTHRCLINTTPQVAEQLRGNLELANFPLAKGTYYPLTPGAPGGSLYLHRQRYIDAGGHDANYCWGYGPEDALFFNKVKLLEPIAYADDPPIKMIHLWHLTAQHNNPYRHEMDWFVKVHFESKAQDEKMEFLKAKKHLLESSHQEIQNSDYNKMV